MVFGFLGNAEEDKIRAAYNEYYGLLQRGYEPFDEYLSKNTKEYRIKIPDGNKEQLVRMYMRNFSHVFIDTDLNTVKDEEILDSLYEIADLLNTMAEAVTGNISAESMISNEEYLDRYRDVYNFSELTSWVDYGIKSLLAVKSFLATNLYTFEFIAHCQNGEYDQARGLVKLRKDAILNDQVIYNLRTTIPILKAFSLTENITNFDLVAKIPSFADDISQAIAILIEIKAGYYDILNTYKGLNKGSVGESAVYNYLSEYKDDEHVVLSSVNLPYSYNDRHTIHENDIIIVCPNGIFTIEVKNYTGMTIKISADGKVEKFKSGKPLEGDNKDKNIIQQSKMHENSLKTFLKEGFPDLKLSKLVHSMAVAANQDLDLENRSNFAIFRDYMVYDYIASFPEVLTDEQVDEIASYIRENQVDAVKFKQRIYNDYFFSREFLTNFAATFWNFNINFMVKQEVMGIENLYNPFYSNLVYPVLDKHFPEDKLDDVSPFDLAKNPIAFRFNVSQGSNIEDKAMEWNKFLNSYIQESMEYIYSLIED